MLTLGIILTGIDRAQPWRDELATWSAASRSLPDLARLTGNIDAATGPYYLFTHGWIMLFGDSTAALRLPSALAVSAAAGLTTVLGQRLVGPRAGLLAGLLFAVLPGTSRYGQEARPYALATLLAVLATLLLVEAVRRPAGWGRWLAYAVTVLALGLTHLVALTLLPAHGVLVLVASRRDGGRWLLALVPTVLGVAPLVLAARAQRGRQLDWVDPARWTDLTSLPGGLAQSVAVGGLLLGLAALGTVRFGRRAVVPAACLLLPVLLLFTVALVVPLWVPRYLFFTVPFGCLLAGAALTLAPGHPTRPGSTGTGVDARPPTRRSWKETAPTGASIFHDLSAPPVGATLPPALVVVALVGLLGLPDQVALRRTHEWPRSAAVDYRGAAQVVAAGQRPGDAVVYSPRDGWLFLDLGLAYHLGPARPRDVLVVRDQARRADLWADECGEPATCLAGVNRVWLVTAGRRADPLAAVGGAKGAALRADFTTVQVWPRAGLTVTLLTRQP
ncbi:MULTISPECIES: glycosyltransferase family 39 protein [Micromonospora]|uniref:Dolichyl-phosphate-mannose-protein mannosyltransferase n=1 Tax=Micromonospora yangpuensis TaxID=683228 RepID=A0A1C6V847_9ACTN|nr:glycosyltransferase family 39 protein [Micromonospora yangpuensis]GGM28557.1 hypothetical protein GCM10012279_53970 [Micromonospora yangpuensis]SCL62488.1 Dolichyl-phosphate-mannose-protein mannosyltransferase [Micromonospora yangpuensis]